MCHYRRPTESGCGWGQGTVRMGTGDRATLQEPSFKSPDSPRLQAPVESICTYPRVPSPTRTSPVPGPLPYPRGSKGPFSPAPAARALSPGRVARVGWSSVCPVPHMFVPHMFPVPPSPSLFRSAGPNPGWGQGKFSKASLKASGTSLGWTRPFHADPGVGPGQCGKPLPAYLAVRFLPCPHVPTLSPQPCQQHVPSPPPLCPRCPPLLCPRRGGPSPHTPALPRLISACVSPPLSPVPGVVPGVRPWRPQPSPGFAVAWHYPPRHALFPRLCPGRVLYPRAPFSLPSPVVSPVPAATEQLCPVPAGFCPRRFPRRSVCRASQSGQCRRWGA